MQVTAPALGTVPEPMKPYDAEAPVVSEPFQSRFFTVRELPEPEEDPFQSWATDLVSGLTDTNGGNPDVYLFD